MARLRTKSSTSPASGPAGDHETGVMDRKGRRNRADVLVPPKQLPLTRLAARAPGGHVARAVDRQVVSTPQRDTSPMQAQGVQRRRIAVAAVTTLLTTGLAGTALGQEAPPVPQEWPAHRCSPTVATDRTVWGWVRDALRQPLASVQVYVQGRQCGMLTDSEGRYALVGVPVGAFSVRADLIGYLSDSTPLPAAPDDARRDFVLHMPRGDEELVTLAEHNPWGIPRPVAASVVGCFRVAVLEEYGLPIRAYGGPWETRPATFRGLPALVLVDTFKTSDDRLALTGTTVAHTLDADPHGEMEDRIAWRFSVNSDSLDATWTGAPMLWWIRYRLSVDADSLVGRSWYLSHEPSSATPSRPVVWRRSRCGAGG